MSEKKPKIVKSVRTGKFKRIEDKVLLTLEQAEHLLEEVNRHMKPSYLHEGTEFTLIASYYFDSPKLDFFHHHFLKTPKRYKLRMRRYAPNGIWSSEAPVIELKSKEEGVSKKRRFILTSDNYERLTKGEPLVMTDDLKALNPKAEEAKLLKWMMKINSLITEFGLRPAMKVQYKRHAFESADGFRLTIDRNLEIEPLARDIAAAAGNPEISGEIWQKAARLAARYERDRHCVVELKHTGEAPEWVQSFLKQRQIEETSFSKYCWAVHCTVRPGAPKSSGGEAA